MSFYPKQIRSREELKLEKEKLLAQSGKTDIKQLFSLDDLLKSKDINKTPDKTSEEGDLIEKIFIESSLADLAMEYVAPLLQKACVKIGSAGKEVGKKMFRSVAKEVLGGYLKWKAAELSYKAIAHLISSRKKKKHNKS